MSLFCCHIIYTQDLQTVIEKQRREIASLSRVTQDGTSKSHGLEQEVMRLKTEIAEWSKRYDQEAALHAKVRDD